MRKIIAYLAVSADGYIARKDGSVDWLEKVPAPKGKDGIAAFVKTVDTIVWGRKTYDQALSWGQNPSFSPKIRNYVCTSKPAAPADTFEFTNEPPAQLAARLRSNGGSGKNIWMMGGGAVIASFLDAGEIDEFSLHVIPVMIGEGIPLIAPGRRTVAMKLLSAKHAAGGVVVRYRVLKR